MGRRSIQTWVQLTGTLLGSDIGNGSAFVLGWIDGNATGTFAISDVKILRLNSGKRTGSSQLLVSAG